MRVASRNDAGISGHGSAADTSLCIVSNSPTLSSRQWPEGAVSSSQASAPATAGATSAAPSARGGAAAGGAERSRICSRPPSAITTARPGGVTPAGAANFSTSGKA
jgi:hypothetical protein